MSMGVILQLYLIGSGICIFIQVLLALAGRRMVEAYSVPWAVLAVCLVIIGCVIQPGEISRYIGWPFFIFLLLGLSLVLRIFFRMTEHQSDLQRKFSELSMQVSLLNEENSRMRKTCARLHSQDHKNSDTTGDGAESGQT
jgi:hypothetical protein